MSFEKDYQQFGQIYLATNVINGKVYVGQTVKHIRSPKKRHRGLAAKGDERHFYAAIRKHGWDNFDWSIVDYANDEDELNQKETFYVAFHKSHLREFGYNLTLGGDGVRATEDVKARMSQKAKERDPETRRSALEAAWKSNTGKKRPEFALKISLILKDRPKTDIQIHNSIVGRYQNNGPDYTSLSACEKISDGNKARWQDPEFVAKRMAERNTPEHKELRKGVTKNLWLDPLYRAQMEIIQQSPEYKALMKKSCAEAWLNPEYAERMAKLRATPEYHELMSRVQKEKWNDEEWAKKRREQLAELGLKRRGVAQKNPMSQNEALQNDPEWKRKNSELQASRILGKKRITKDGAMKFVKEELIDQFLAEGWTLSQRAQKGDK